MMPPANALPAGKGPPSPENPATPVPATVEIVPPGVTLRKNATVNFAGLAPGFVGLYKVNAVVPAGVTGDSVPVVLGAYGQSSPSVTISVR
jgi:uncharacterized protein (TIGR03437 family)